MQGHVGHVPISRSLVSALLGPPGAGRVRSATFVLLTLFALATALADASTAHANISRWGVAGEGNPFAQFVLVSHGFDGLLAMKIGGIAWSALVAWLMYRIDHFGKACSLLGFAIVVNLIGTITNLAA